MHTALATTVRIVINAFSLLIKRNVIKNAHGRCLFFVSQNRT